MQRDWDERARDNVFHYICSERGGWDRESFFQSGEEDYAQLVAPVLCKLGFAPAGKSMLEVGCGVGRVTRSFARRFTTVLALDISEEMLRRGRELNKDFANIVWVWGNGGTLEVVPSDSMDFVFSYLVLQHLPAKELVLSYVREMLRVLKPGGAYCFQFNGCLRPTMNWKGRLVWGLIDRSMEPHRGVLTRAAGRGLVSALSLDGLAAGKSWRGAAVPARQVLETVWQAGAAVHGVTGWGDPRTWCHGKKC
jgi:SAM-dependent methyltransferase